MSSLEPNDHYYRRLEVDHGASHEAIVQAYRRLAHGVHPDTHPEDPEASRRFREISEAYEVLANPARRASYDRDQASDAGRTIRVVVRPAAGPTWGSGEVPGGSVGEQPPVVLGATPRAAGNAPLRAGPVRIDRHGASPAEDRPAPSDNDEGGLWPVFSDLLQSLWRR